MRKAEINRKTSETSIEVQLDLDGRGRADIHTGIGFLDHMLTHLAFQGMLDLTVQAEGDLDVDAHHTAEDCALAVGQAFDQALQDRSGINRTGSAFVPMDETLAHTAVDFSGRPYCVLDVEWNASMLGTLPVDMIEHFFQSFSTAARATVHSRVLYGRSDHHKAEAMFKALGKAVRHAVELDQRRAGGIPSTKGVL